MCCELRYNPLAQNAKVIENVNTNEVSIGTKVKIEYVEDEDIETIRYEYKNIMVYFDIEDGIGEYSDCITVYSDEGRQFHRLFLPHQGCL